MSSRLPGFYRLPIEQRRKRIAVDSAMEARLANGGLTDDIVDTMIENAVGVFGMPLGIAANFLVDGVDRLLPMAIEEPSVVAAASHAAKLVRAGGGFVTEVGRSIMTGQVQLTGVLQAEIALRTLEARRDEWLELARKTIPRHIDRGGDVTGISFRAFPQHSWVIAHVDVDCLDAMGANTINTVCEALAPSMAQSVGGGCGLRILTNLCDQRMASARAKVPLATLAAKGDAETVAKGVAEAADFAAADPYRAATHNKGILNGIDALLIALANDWRGVEAGAHAYAARSGHYAPLSRWWVADEHLHGEIELPLAVASVGGSLNIHPLARDCLTILGVNSATELAACAAAAGLATNLAALLALSTEGIQRGHMSLHARKVALLAGVESAALQRVSQQMAQERNITIERARELAECDTNE